MPIKPLVEIRVEHPFFASGLCAGARVVPEPASAARLRGLRLVAKEKPGALTVLAELSPEGRAAVPVPPLTLRFHLLGLPQDLAEVTDMTAIAPGTLFTDAGGSRPMKAAVPESRAMETVVKPAGPAAIVLAGRPLGEVTAAAFRVLDGADGVRITAYDADSNSVRMDGPGGTARLDYPVAPRSAPGTFAAIDIDIGPETVVKAAAGKPRRFTIALKAAAARWCYHLVTDLPNPVAEWRIAHPAADGLPVNFAAGGRAEIASPDAADPFGTALLERSAPLRVLRFLSDAPVACSEARARRLALFAGDRQLFTALPNPPPTSLRLVGGRPAFGEVLRFVTV
jgi:hypothetical protein